jgi:BatD DUF11 like domain
MVSLNIKLTFSLLLAIAASLFCFSVAAASIKVTSDRDPVGLNESFMLTFESDSSVDGEPDFSPLNKDFQVLSRNSSTNMSIVNGKISSSKKWQLTVLARRAGKLLIPAIRFGKDRSQASFVNVTNGRSSTSTSNGNEDIFVEVTVESNKPYVQSEVVYTVRLFLAVSTSNASLSEPGVSGASAVIERLGEDRNFQTNRGGKRYNVVERRYAIYPQVSGSMTIEPVMFQGQINRSAFSLFDPFGPQPLTIIERSVPITLEVQSVSDKFPGGYWIPAKNLSLSESWSQDPPQFQVGEPLTRTLTLVAEGQTASQLLELPEWVPDAFKQYPDQPVLHDDKSDKGITASRQEKVAIIPNRSGDYVLPEISVPWWNTRTNKLEYARIPERKITVAALENENTPGMTGLPALDNANIVMDENNEDIPEAGVSTEGLETGQVAGFWQGLSAGLALAWLVTLLLWWRSRSANKKEAPQDNRALHMKEVLKAVERACKEAEPEKVKQALLLWGQQVWPDSPPTNLGEIGKRSAVELSEKIMQLNNCLYSQRKESWEADSFWQVFKTNHAASGKQEKKQEGELEPLYRL